MEELGDRLYRWFRRFLQREAPGHAQFFRAEVTGTRRLLSMLAAAEPYYYVVTWLHLIDCIDLRKSEYDVEEEPDDIFFRLVLHSGDTISEQKDECATQVKAGAVCSD
jgi:hypothetical protein